MMKDAMIYINSIYSYGQGDEDNLEFATEGYYLYGDDAICMSYLESELTGMEGTRTSVMVLPGQVVIDRDGMITSRMEFGRGKKNSFQYNTPYGTAIMGIDTRSIQQSFDVNGGKLELEYVVDMEHAIVTRNKFQMTVKVTEDESDG